MNLDRSFIHGRGLFCKRPIEDGEMVIEYSGVVIRAILTDKREKFYESKVCNPKKCNTLFTLFTALCTTLCTSLFVSLFTTLCTTLFIIVCFFYNRLILLSGHWLLYVPH